MFLTVPVEHLQCRILQESCLSLSAIVDEWKVFEQKEHCKWNECYYFCFNWLNNDRFNEKVAQVLIFSFPL